MIFNNLCISSCKIINILIHKINSQYPSPTTNNVVFFPSPNNANIYFRSQINNTHEVEFSHREPETLIGFMSERQVPQFSTQIGIENITIKGEERPSIKKKNFRAIHMK